MKGERFVGGALIVATFGSLLFVGAYLAGADRVYEGLALALAAAALSAAALGWAFWLIPAETVTDQITTYPSSRAERSAENTTVRAEGEAVVRSRALVRLLCAALGAFAAALVVPIASLGPASQDGLFHTKWRRGSRLARPDGRPVYATELNVDSAVTVFPADAIGDAQSQAVLIRLPEDLAAATQGYIAYSKLCTHAGCPVALYRAAEKQLMCPCHQSVFDVTSNGSVVSGPADHALPRLPIAIAADGTLVANGDFPEPVGPGFWQRDD